MYHIKHMTYSIRDRSEITSSKHKGGGISEKMILDYVEGGRGLAKDDG